MKPFIFLVPLFLFMSCSERKKGNTFFIDYEQSFGWQSVPVVKGSAHSGAYAEVINPEREFSITFQSTCAQIEPELPLPQISADVWLYATKLQQPVLLVLQVSDPSTDSTIIYQAVEIQPAEVNGKWYNSSLKYRITSELKGNFLCKIFLWNPNKQNFLADDFTIAFEK